MNLRYPSITGLTEKEQLTQIKSFLHQLVEHLNYALPSSGTGDGSTQSATPGTIEVQGGEMSYYELRSMIIHELQQLNTKFSQLSQQVYNDVDKAVELAIQDAKDSGEFKGADGYTPVKGVDYFTEEDIKSVTAQVAGKISFTLDEDGNLYYEVEE